MNTPTATIRKDLQEKGTYVPIGNIMYGSKKPLPYRWLNDYETFQVYYNGQWLNAYSIDFEFN